MSAQIGFAVSFVYKATALLKQRDSKGLGPNTEFKRLKTMVQTLSHSTEAQGLLGRERVPLCVGSWWQAKMLPLIPSDRSVSG